MYIARYQFVSIAWAGLNLAVARYVVETRPFPWLAMVGFAAAPLLFIFFAEIIAARLQRGWMERWASDYGKQQHPMPIMLIGWLCLAVQTIFLILQI